MSEEPLWKKIFNILENSFSAWDSACDAVDKLLALVEREKARAFREGQLQIIQAQKGEKK